MTGETSKPEELVEHPRRCFYDLTATYLPATDTLTIYRPRSFSDSLNQSTTTIFPNITGWNSH